MPVREIVWSSTTLLAVLVTLLLVVPLLPASLTDAPWFVVAVVGYGLLVGDLSHRAMRRTAPGAAREDPTG